ncbi:MAG: septation protein A [Alphaproteobacteria bacterium]|nr:septation protein A [Alphaproteobacteria bacterium]
MFRRTMHPLLKFALDLGPLLVFFIGNSYFGIFPATAMFMVAVTLSLAITYAIAKRISPMPIVTGVVVLVFGGLTLLLNDELFIKLKPTIVNTIFASVLLAGVLTERLYIKILFDNAFHLPDDAWKTLTYRWIGFFVFLAILNEVIWRNFSTDFWVGFKLWGVVPISMAFGIAQMPFILKNQIKQPDDETPKTV